MKKNIILGARLLMPDFQRGGDILPLDQSLTKVWEDSASNLSYKTKILCVTQKDINPDFNLGANKVFAFLAYLKKHIKSFNFVLLADTLDVVFLNKGLFEFMKPNTLYVGDEPCCLGINWILQNSYPFLFYNEYKEWFNSNKDLPLLNTGLIGGEISVVIDILECMSNMLLDYTKGLDIGADMFCLNYCAYNSKYPIIHGEPFNTVFKSFDHDNTCCYVAHK